MIGNVQQSVLKFKIEVKEEYCENWHVPQPTARTE